MTAVPRASHRVPALQAAARLEGFAIEKCTQALSCIFQLRPPPKLPVVRAVVVWGRGWWLSCLTCGAWQARIIEVAAVLTRCQELCCHGNEQVCAVVRVVE